MTQGRRSGRWCNPKNRALLQSVLDKDAELRKVLIPAIARYWQEFCDFIKTPIETKKTSDPCARIQSMLIL
jgi:hypothetical protein